MRGSTLWFDARPVRRLLSLWLWATAFGLGVWADETARPDEALPAELSPAERRTLQKETDPKGRLDAGLQIGVARLATATEAVKREHFDAAAQSLRVYTGVMEYLHGYTQQTAKEKVRRQMLRKLETTLRQQLPLLEWMANNMPECHEGCARRALQRAKIIRRDSLNAFFGDDFLKAGVETATE